jgi:hypothetical protein
VPDITVKISATQEQALSFAKQLARDDDFRARVAADPTAVLAEHGINIDLGGEVAFAPVLPPKHVIEEALVNINEASEFASEAGFTSPDPFAFWLFVIFLAT